jgi:hypothetical protein
VLCVGRREQHRRHVLARAPRIDLGRAAAQPAARDAHRRAAARAEDLAATSQLAERARQIVDRALAHAR